MWGGGEERNHALGRWTCWGDGSGAEAQHAGESLHPNIGGAGGAVFTQLVEKNVQTL